MSVILLTDSKANADKVAAQYLDNISGVKDYIPASVSADYCSHIFDSLQEAVAASQKIIISVAPEAWDPLILGKDGLLVSVTEETEIVCYTALSDHKVEVYKQFFSSKNLNFTYLSQPQAQQA